MRSAAAILTCATLLSSCYLSHELEAATPGLDAGMPERVTFTELAAGDDHTCAVDGVGGVWCWGFGQQGQLGLGIGDADACEVRITEGPIVDRPTRLPEEELGLGQRVAAGALHACVSTADRGIACWGGNCRGQLGRGDARGALAPARVAATDAPGWTNVWAGGTHTCALDRERRTWCWGANAYGQLGLGTTSPMSEPGSTVPVRIDDFGVPVQMGLGVAHTCAIVGAGAVLCWGANGAGQLGDGTHAVRSRPAPVEMLPGSATAVTAGDRHACAILDGRAWCWGWNARGQLGDGVRCAPDDEACVERNLPVRVALDVRTEAIEAGSQHTCAAAEGSVHCWGANDVGQLGDGTNRSSSRPVRVSGIDDAIALTVGANHACALRRDGSAWCWGRNAQGQLGDGTRRDSAVPVRADPMIVGRFP